MISAQEAREMTATLCKEAERNLEDIEAEIKQEAAKGNRDYWQIGYVHQQALRVLKSLGYELQECDSQIDGYSLHVKW
jgi:transcription termination factor NusB